MTKIFRQGKRNIVGFWVVSLTVSFSANCQDLEPRTYANTPVGLNFLIAG